MESKSDLTAADLLFCVQSIPDVAFVSECSCCPEKYQMLLVKAIVQPLPEEAEMFFVVSHSVNILKFSETF